MKNNPSKKRKTLKRSLGLLLCFTLLAIAAGCGNNAKTTNLKLATGGTSGTYYSFGGAVAQVLQNSIPGVSFSVQSTGASKANIRLVADQEADLAIVQNDVMSYANLGTELFEGDQTDGFLSLGTVYPEICQIIASPKSGIQSIKDLKGKRVSVGDAGSGVEANAKQILDAYGIGFQGVTVQNLSFGDSANAMKDQKIDAFFCTAGTPTTAIMELVSTNPVTILGIDDQQVDTLISTYPFYIKYTIPADTYKGMTGDVQTLAIKATVIVRSDLDEELVYKITKALYEGKEAISAAHAKGKEMDVNTATDGVPVDLHPGAIRYFKEIGVL